VSGVERPAAFDHPVNGAVNSYPDGEDVKHRRCKSIEEGTTVLDWLGRNGLDPWPSIP
jgi:hypothetical protein